MKNVYYYSFIVIFVWGISIPCFALTDGDWDTVNSTLISLRNVAGADPVLNTQCNAAGICLEAAKWLYVNNLDQVYRENLITKADTILNISNFDQAPWAVYYNDIGISILATESMAYLFRHAGTNHVFLDTIYYYDPALGTTHAECQRLFLRPTGNTNGYLWAVECRTSDGSIAQIRYSNAATAMSAPVIGGTNGQNAWIKFIWNNVSIPSTSRVVKVEVKVEVYTGQQNIAGISTADSKHGAWWIDVTPVSGSTYHLWSVEFPVLNRIQKYHRISEEAYLLMPKNGGTLFPVGQLEDPAFLETSYPGSEIPYQLVLNTQKNACLLYYCDDKQGFTKFLRAGDADVATRLTWVHWPKWQGMSGAAIKLSDSADLGYACRIGVHSGDWFDVAIWFRENWLSNKWADFLPSTMRGGWLIDAHHGSYSWGTLKNEYDNWLQTALNTHFPGTAWLGSHTGYSWRPDFQPETIKYNGQWIYEPMVQIVNQIGRAYVYDPIQGSHYNRINQLRSNHNERVLLYTAGRLLCKRFYNFGQYPDSPHYNNSNQGETWAVRTPTGSQPYIVRKDSNNNTVGLRGYVCPANPDWRAFISGQIAQLMLRAGSENQYPWGVYLDVTCNRPTYGGPCYSSYTNHGHPDQRGGGNFYALGTIALINQIRQAAQDAGNPNFVVATEGHGDIFIKHLDSFIHFQNDEEDENIGGDFVSIPFALALWADKIRPYADKSAGEGWDYISRTPLKTARAFVYGVGLGRIKKDAFENSQQITALKRMVNYRRNFAGFLARGRLYRPPAIDNSNVLCATWKNGEDFLFAFANSSASSSNIVTSEFNLKALGVSNPQAYKLYGVEENGTYESDLTAEPFPANGVLTKTFTLSMLGSTTGNKGVYCYVAKKICSTSQPDINNDNQVDIADFNVVATHWLRQDCGQSNNCCQGVDLISDGKIDQQDLMEMINYWLGL